MTEDARNTRFEDFLAEVDRKEKPAGGPMDRTAEEPMEENGLLGERVLKIREAKGLSLSDVASRTGYEESYLKRIEANELSPPLGVLIKLGKALDMTMGFFISGGENKVYTVVRQEERRKIARRAASQDEKYGYTYQALAPGKTDRHMEPFLVTLEPSDEENLSAHEGQEFIYVLDGHMEAILGEDRLVLSEGDAIYYDSNLPHMVRCVDGPHTRILAVLYAHEK
ncbi:MAG: cupin domain-containing protein [Proteobacteria bacterium]|nr:cupin domain-containing protein [Pseudomonadota bacterium]